MPNPLVLPILNWARKLKHPALFKVTAVLFAISLLWPFDPIPFIDEIVLGLGTLLLANWKKRRDERIPGQGEPIDGSATRR